MKGREVNSESHESCHMGNASDFRFGSECCIKFDDNTVFRFMYRGQYMYVRACVFVNVEGR